MGRIREGMTAPFGVFSGPFRPYCHRGLDILMTYAGNFFGAFYPLDCFALDRLIICRISNPWKGDSGDLLQHFFWINGNCFQHHEFGRLYFQKLTKNFQRLFGCNETHSCLLFCHLLFKTLISTASIMYILFASIHRSSIRDRKLDLSDGNLPCSSYNA